MRVILISAIMTLLVACGGGKGQNQAQQKNKKSAHTQQTNSSRAQSGAFVNDPVFKGNPTKTRKRSAWPFEDGKTQSGGTAANMLMSNIYVVYDGSGSMSVRGCSGNVAKSQAAGRALIEFSRRVSAQSNLGLLVFDRSGISERVPLGINNRAEFTAQVNRVEPYGGTPLRSAIKLAKEKLTQQAKKQLGYGEYHLVVVTDGAASAGQDPRGVVNDILGNSPIVVHTIGFCIGSHHSLNQPGRTLYKSANNYAALKKGLEGILAEAQDFTVTEF